MTGVLLRFLAFSPIPNKKKRATNVKTILFVDVDGVLSIPTPETASDYEKFGFGLPAWPVPLAYLLIQAIDADRSFYPIWLSCWDTDARIWNDRANTRHWRVGYHLSSRQANYARKVLPSSLFVDRIDRKLIAVQYYLRKWNACQAVTWIEDGFADETRQWAAERGGVRLIDTTTEPILSLLLSKDQSAIQQFIELLK